MYIPLTRLRTGTLLIGVLWCARINAAIAHVEEPVTATVESTVKTASKQIRQFAFDGSIDTYFRSEKPSGGTKNEFRLVFAKPVTVTSVSVLSGRPDGTDAINAGTLEASADGQSFEEIAKFSKGIAHEELKGREVLALRIKADGDEAIAVREITVDSSPKVATYVYPIEYEIDVADAPEMKEWADKVARLCEQWYPKIGEALKSEGFRPRTWVRLSLKGDYKGVAMAGGGNITGSVKFFKDHPDDLGAMIHETVHIIQAYRGRGNPGWLVEGVADYIRFFQYEPGKIGRINAARAHYNGSYRVTAAFLAFITNKYDKNLVPKLNALMRDGKYKDEVFREFTGKTLKELDEEWRESIKPKEADKEKKADQPATKDDEVKPTPNP